MELAMQFSSNDKTAGSNRVKDLQDFNSQSSATQSEKKIVFMIAAIKKMFI